MPSPVRGGALHRLYEDWRTLGLSALAHLEAAIDFPDEDIDFLDSAELHTRFAGVEARFEALEQRFLLSADVVVPPPPPPMITTLAGSTPGTPPSSMPLPPRDFSSAWAPA